MREPAPLPAAADRAGTEPVGRWRLLAVLATAELLAMAPWFSAAAVAPLLRTEWAAGGIDLALLTVAVQIGFAVGALGLAVSGAPDVLPARVIFVVGALVAAAANLGFALLARDVSSALPFRVLTGLGLAGVYPVAMKVLAGWFRRERGLAIGVLIGALTVGSALPHLLSAMGALGGLDWRSVVILASGSAVLAAVVVMGGVRPGPFEVQAPRFSVDLARRGLGQPAVRLANLGYLGHMWELYAMWTWLPLFLAASFAAAGTVDPALSSLAAFVAVGIGGVGCVVAGYLADRLGRTTLTIAAMAASGTSAVLAGALFGAWPPLLLAVVVIWGLTVIADSAQFSTAMSELAPPGTAGSVLALQTSLGFLLTGLPILLVGVLLPGDDSVWRVAFGMLAVGPLIGIYAMWRLRGRPEAAKMASGHR